MKTAQVTYIPFCQLNIRTTKNILYLIYFTRTHKHTHTCMSVRVCVYLLYKNKYVCIYKIKDKYVCIFVIT